jgi:hypothetical protein
MKKHEKKGISTVAATVLFVILIFTLQTILFLAIYRYNNSLQDSIRTEQERIQERIVLSALLTDNSTGIEEIYALLANNTGSITVHIRAIYVDSQFISDPSNASINPGDTYVNAKETLWILTPHGIPYNPSSTITIATERGTKSTDYEGRLKQSSGERPPTRFDKFYLGPLMLDFNKFYYATVDAQTGALTSQWMYGWEIFAGTGPVAWNITVKNIDDRDITINQFSVFTLWANDQPSNRLPWYIEPPTRNGSLSLTQHIKVNETVQIVYKWATPKMNQTKTPNTQSIYNTDARCRTFLTFFGIFHEKDGTTKPYGQTIPFEAVLVDKVTITISASPPIIAANSTMTSTITTVVTKNGKPAAGAFLTFMTTAGTLSSYTATTDASGTTQIYLYPGVNPATATVTANWITLSKSTTVQFVVPTVQVAALPTSLVVKSAMNSAITATVRLATTPWAGVNVTFRTTAGNLSSLWAITDGAGAARVNLTAGLWSSPTTATVTAKYLYVTGSTNVQFTFETIQLTASPNVIPVNSTSRSTITAIVLAGTSPVRGANLTFSTDAGSLSSIWAVTDTNGRATVYLTAGTITTTANVTVTWINTVASTNVRFETETIQIAASPGVIAANSSMQSTITTVVRFNGSPVSGANVTFTIDVGTLSSAWALTDATGTSRVYLSPSADPATATVTAKWINTLASVTVHFETSTVRISASQSVIPTNSTVNSIITALVKLGTNPYQGANVTFTTTAGSLSRYWAITNASGMAAVNLAASASPTTASVTAAWMNSRNSTTVRFTNLFITTDRQQYAQNDMVKISGFLRYENGTAIQGVAVSLNVTASNGTVIWSVTSSQTDVNGAFTYDLQLINASLDTYAIVATYQSYEERYQEFTVI